jgi:hypothetical protein
MNQGIAFARTLRALDADDFRASKLGLLVAALLVAAWAWWIFSARVPQYESTTNVRIESGHAIAYFPPEIVTRIHPGQSALIHSESGPISSRVESVASDHVQLALPANGQLRASSIEVEIRRVSPASIALESLGIRNR